MPLTSLRVALKPLHLRDFQRYLLGQRRFSLRIGFGPSAAVTPNFKGNVTKMNSFKLNVSADHVSGLAKLRKPILGIEELVWNALDADATIVEINFERNLLDAIDRITVSDNGSGITPDEAAVAFGNLGGSRKRTAGRSAAGRVLHGKEGKGRFRAFGLGGKVEWVTRYRNANGDVMEWSVSGDDVDLCSFRSTEPLPARSEDTGTTVVVSRAKTELGGLSTDATRFELLSRLAIYLKAYPTVEVYYDGLRLDVEQIQKQENEYSLLVELPDGSEVRGDLTIIEWAKSVDRVLYLCTPEGLARDGQPANIQAPGYHFTAYLRTDLVASLPDAEVDIVTMNPKVARLIVAARGKLREHFELRKLAQAAEVLERWRSEGVYPYDQPATSPVERAVREVFDICAINIHQKLSGFDASDPKTKRFSLRLLRQAVEVSPSSLQDLLNEVLALTATEQTELVKLLRRTKLSSIIRAARVVSERLTFIHSLEILLFDKHNKKQLLERSQLQRILVNELWLFGEQYALGIDDKSLKALLESHEGVLGRVPSGGDVKDINGDQAIPDLMLYRRFSDRSEGRYEHLVIELKRPSKKLGSDEISQIEKYAYKVSEDPRFDKGMTKWVFILIGDELEPFAEAKCTQQGRPYGLIDSKPHLEIWVKKWSTAIQECKWRHEFYRRELNLEVQSVDAVEYLNEKYAQYLPNTPTLQATERVSRGANSAAPGPTKTRARGASRKKRQSP